MSTSSITSLRQSVIYAAVKWWEFDVNTQGCPTSRLDDLRFAVRKLKEATRVPKSVNPPS